MKPSETGHLYDAIASWWDAQQDGRTTGLHFVRRAISLASGRGKALDVGCGSGGRIVDALVDAGFEVVGIDASEALLKRARARHPRSQFIHADICEWNAPEKYDTIVAWDSIFHVPHASQRQVVDRLCDALAPGGSILFTAGGIDGEITGPMNGHTFYYSSLAIEEYLEVFKDRSCRCVLVDRDQYPEEHVVIIGKKEETR